MVPFILSKLKPHSEQNLNADELLMPHFGQMVSNLFPHTTQNLADCGLLD
jgi:hypothetical protein